MLIQFSALSEVKKAPAIYHIYSFITSLFSIFHSACALRTRATPVSPSHVYAALAFAVNFTQRLRRPVDLGKVAGEQRAGESHQFDSHVIAGRQPDLVFFRIYGK